MLFLMMGEVAIGAQGREKRVIEQVRAATKNICAALFTPRSAG
jgi:hypothetical protein